MNDSRDSLNTNAPTSARQQSVGEVPEEVLRVLAREIVDQAGLQREVPEEVLQVLAREIVEQAGLKSDPELARRREMMRDSGDTFRQLSTLSGSAAVAVVVIQQAFGLTGALADLTQRVLGTEGALSPLNSLAAVTLTLIALSFLLSVGGLVWTSLLLTRHDEQTVRRYPVKRIRWLTAFAAFFLISGISGIVVNAITASPT